jgi:hypothetical protein
MALLNRSQIPLARSDLTMAPGQADSPFSPPDTFNR